MNLSCFYTLEQSPEGVIYPDDINSKNIRGYYSDINVLIRTDGSIDFEVLLFYSCFHNMKDFLYESFGIETFEQLLADERLYEDCLGGTMPLASFEGNIPKEFQHEALFRLISSPDGFAEWVDKHDGYNGYPDWRI